MYKIDRRGGGRGSKNRSLGNYQKLYQACRIHETECRNNDIKHAETNIYRHAGYMISSIMLEKLYLACKIHVSIYRIYTTRLQDTGHSMPCT